MRLSILEWHMVAESYLAVFAEIRRGVFVLHAHVSNKVKLHLFKFFDGHSSYNKATAPRITGGAVVYVISEICRGQI